MDSQPNINGTFNMPGYANGLPLRHRPPTVDEALQYTPLTSIIPFHPDLIPYPSAGPPPSSTIFSSSEEREAAKSQTRVLEAESETGTTSQRLQRTLIHLQNLLRSDDLTEYKFKQPAALPYTPVNSQTAPTSNGHSQSSRAAPKLSKIAKMVLEETDVAFRYPSPVSPVKEPKKDAASVPRKEVKVEPRAQHVSQIPPKQQSSQQPAQVHNQQAHRQNARAVEIPVLSQPRVKVEQPAVKPPPENKAVNAPPPRPSPQKQTNGIAVVIPQLPSGSQRSEYETVTAEATEMKKRKHEDVDEPSLHISSDERQRADVAFNNLTGVFSDLFNAEDQLPDSSTDSISAYAANFFALETVNLEDLPVIVPGCLSRLDSALRSLLETYKFRSVPAEDLLRVQRLCSNGAQSVIGLSFRPDQAWSEQDLDEWVVQLAKAGHGLQAAVTLLRTMAGNHSDKQIYSEDLFDKIITALKYVVEDFIVPINDMHATSMAKEARDRFMAHQKSMNSLLQTFSRVLRYLAVVLSKVDLSEGIAVPVENMAIQLLFVERPLEKDAILPPARLDSIRRVSMDLLAKIFQRFQEQRTPIITDILSSLEKLPKTRQSARQYRLPNGKAIQLVSALLMQLVHTIASGSSSPHSSRSSKLATRRSANVIVADSQEVDEAKESDEDQDEDDAEGEYIEEEATGRNMNAAGGAELRRLSLACKGPWDQAYANANLVVYHLVQKAQSSAKSDTDSLRGLLTIFAEDMLTVLSSSEWPAAEVFLRLLLLRLLNIEKDSGSTALMKTFSLDMMGLLGSGIAELRNALRRQAQNLDSSSDLSNELIGLAERLLDGNISDVVMFEGDGPHRLVFEHLYSEMEGDERLSSALDFHSIRWANTVREEAAKKQNAQTISPKLLTILRKVVYDRKWLAQEGDFKPIHDDQFKLVSSMVALQLPFGRSLERIVATLMNSMRSEQASVKNRSLKSVVQLIETDPSILQRSNQLVNEILRCTTDKSSQVRDSALGLLGECFVHRRALEAEHYNRVLACISDEAMSVRKKAMRLSVQVYERNNNDAIRAPVTATLLRRMSDEEDDVVALAQQILEDLWFKPFYATVTAKQNDVQAKLALREHVTLVIQTIEQGPVVIPLFAAFLKFILSNDVTSSRKFRGGDKSKTTEPSAKEAKSKNMTANDKVCREIVALLFERIIYTDGEKKTSVKSAMHALTVFARADPGLFSSDQLDKLAPYAQSLKTTDDIAMFKPTITILRHVLPTLKSFQHSFLSEILVSLLNNLSKLAGQGQDLDEVASCVWTIASVVNQKDRIIRLTNSFIKGIAATRGGNISDETVARKLRSLLSLAGAFGRYISFTGDEPSFAEVFPGRKGPSIPELLVSTVLPLTGSEVPPQLRVATLQSIGSICQGAPKQFMRPEVAGFLQQALTSNDTNLQQATLKSLRDYLIGEEKRAGPGDDVQTGKKVIKVEGDERLDVSMVATDNDSASIFIGQKFASPVSRVAIASLDGPAVTATEIVCTISRQGLLHPRDYVATLVTLAMSPKAEISAMAHAEHDMIHAKSESTLEKQYTRAVEEAFKYQRSVAKDERGGLVRQATTAQGQATQVYTSKLQRLFDVLKKGSVKVRSDFVRSLSKEKVSFELSKLNNSGDPPVQLLLARFALEGLGLLEYSRIGEPIDIIIELEKLVIKGVGVDVAHAIEHDIFNMRIDTQAEIQPMKTEDPQPGMMMMDSTQYTLPAVVAPPAAPPIDPTRLKHLTVAAMICHMAWETRIHLRRMWGLKGKITPQDYKRPLYHTPGVTPEKYWDRMADIMRGLDSTDDMLKACRAFVDVMSIDNEMKVASDDDDDLEAARNADGYETPREDGEDDEPGSGPKSGSKRGRKRKSSVLADVATPSKKKRGRPPKVARRSSTGRKRSSTGSADEDDEPGWD